MFKKKYKKSNWFKGLLEAEQLYKEGYENIQVSDKVLIISTGCGVNRKYLVDLHGVARVQGIHDYHSHVLKNRKIFQKDYKTLDF